MGININTVSTDSFEMDYFRFGEGSVPFVIIPGLSLLSVMISSDAVAKQYEDMAKDYDIYVFDRRKVIPPQYSIRDMASDTACAIQSLGLKDICLFGASMGGMISMMIAIDHPELVSRLVLGSVPVKTADLSAEFDNWIRLAEERDSLSLCMSFGEAIYPHEVFEQYKGAFASMAELATDVDLDRFVKLAKGAEGFDVTLDLCRIKCPVLAISSADDRIVDPTSSARIAAGVFMNEHSRSFMYDDCGHAAYDIAPDYRVRIMEFLNT